jgi:hypothetical protein
VKYEWRQSRNYKYVEFTLPACYWSVCHAITEAEEAEEFLALYAEEIEIWRYRNFATDGYEP